MDESGSKWKDLLIGIAKSMETCADTGEPSMGIVDIGGKSVTFEIYAGKGDMTKIYETLSDGTIKKFGW